MGELAIVVIGRALQILIGLVALRVMTWKLDQEEMGQYALIMTVTTLFALALINPLGMYFYRHIHQWIDEGRGRTVFAVIVLLVMGVAVFSALLLVLASLLGLSFDLAWMLVLIPGSLLFVSLNNTLVPAFNILGYRIRWVLLSVASLGVSLGVSVVLTSDEASSERWILGQLIGHGLLLVPAVIWFRRTAGPERAGYPLAKRVRNFRQQQGVSFLAFIWPLSIAVTLNWGQFQSFRVFLGELASLDTLGYFAAAYAVCAGVMASIESIAQQYFYPKFYKDISTAGREVCVESWRQYAGCMIPVITLFFLFVLGFAKPLLVLLVDAKFHDAVYFVYVAACIEYCRIVGNIYNVFMQATKETPALVIPQLIGCLVALTSVPAFILVGGNLGFSLAVITSSACYVLLIRRAVMRLAGTGTHNLQGVLLSLYAVVSALCGYGLTLIDLNLLLSLGALAGGGLALLVALYPMINQLKVST